MTPYKFPLFIKPFKTILGDDNRPKHLLFFESKRQKPKIVINDYAYMDSEKFKKTWVGFDFSLRFWPNQQALNFNWISQYDCKFLAFNQFISLPFFFSKSGLRKWFCIKGIRTKDRFSLFKTFIHRNVFKRPASHSNCDIFQWKNPIIDNYSVSEK